MFNEYYVSADNSVGESDFERVERENCPEVKEEDRIMQQIHYFGPERWKREGLEQGLAQGHKEGIEKGIERGVEQGIERGIEKGIEKTRSANALRMLTRGMPDAQICDLLQISARELAAIKKNLNNKQR